MAESIKRNVIVTALRKKIAGGQAILAFGAGCGMTARSAERGGADYISIYTTAFRRVEGLPAPLAWLPYGDVNEEMRVYAPGILSLIRSTPCIAGLGVHDPRICIEDLIREFTAMGFSGVSNEPFCSMYGAELCTLLERCGIGFFRELELIQTARKLDVFTAAWAANTEEAVRLAAAGADVIGVLAGLPEEKGEDGESYLVRVIRHVADVVRAAKQENPEVIALVHGGPIVDVATARRAIRESGADGCATGSGGERIPAENAITSVCMDYKNISLSNPEGRLG